MPNRIDELFYETHRVDRATLEALQDDEVEELRRIALDRKDSPNRVRALGFLTQMDSGAAAVIVARILTNPEENGDVRAAAAALAARLGGEAEPVLIDAIGSARESFVRRRIAATLGEIGGPSAIDALRELSNDEDRGVRAQAEFSLSLLAAREGMAGFELPQPSREDLLEPRPEASQPFAIGRASLDETTRVLQSLEGHAYGVAVARDAVYAVSCERDQMMIVLDERMSQPELLEHLAERPMIPALVLSPSPDDATWSVRWIVFAWPDGRERFHVAVHRPAGRQVLFGEMVVEGTGLGFTVESLRGPGQLALRLSGRLAEGRLEVREAIASRWREPGNVPRAFHLPGRSGGPERDDTSHDLSGS